MRHIPNIISLTRIPFSIALLFLARVNIYAFLAAYAVAGIFDVLDGFLARRYHWESELGAKMDSIGDTVFLVCAVSAAILTLDFNIERYNFVALGVLIAVRLGNVLFTKKKFGRFAYIHSNFVRWSTIPIFFLQPLCVVRRELLNLPLLIMVIVVILAALEETWMLKVMEEYDVNMKSIYHMKKHKKRGAPAAEEEQERETIAA